MYKNLLLLAGCLFLVLAVRAQCPDKDSLMRRLRFYVSDTSKEVTAAQLYELSQYEARLQQCAIRGDSIQALLLQRIGVLHYKRHNYAEAIKYITRSNNLIAACIRRRTVDPTLLAKNYYILSLNYDSLNMSYEKLASIDSCIFIFDRLQNEKNINISLQYIMNRLWRRVQSLGDVGDYNRASDFVQMGERILDKSRGFKDSLTYRGYFLTYKVNALLALKNYREAQTLLTRLARYYKRNASYDLLGTIYDLLAQVEIFLHDPRSAAAYFQESVNYGRKVRDTLGCMQTYTNMGYYLYDKYHHDMSLALACYNKGLAWYYASRSLQERNAMEALNLLTNIANIYVQYGLYDSAFHYFRLAFYQIKPGLQESDLLRMPLNKITTFEYLSSLLLDEADAYYNRFIRLKDVYYFDKAIRIYKIADKLLDKIRTEQSDVQSKLFWRRDNHRPVRTRHRSLLRFRR